MSGPPVKKQKLQYKKKFYQNKKKQYLEVGQRGFLATCNFNEKDCVRECYNILNQHANGLFGAEDDGKNLVNDQKDVKDMKNIEEATSDIADELQMQINAAKSNVNKNRRFQVVDTGASNCVFIKTILDDPVAIAESIVKDIAQTKQQKTRHLLRLLPIEVVCKAKEEDILNAAGQLCDKFFLKDHTTFSIVFNKRFNNDMNRDNLIREVANLIHAKNVKNKVDLKHAKKSLIIEVIKGLCCLTVVNDYMAKKKYNLVELAKSNYLVCSKQHEVLSDQDGVNNGKMNESESTKKEDAKNEGENNGSQVLDELSEKV